ncbi:phosphate ABC transporter substrate-binding protein PstS [Larsenimonas rhizosphaerae]|uniref:Phosphate-binding protein PstS n=1 Tax=Larsenimonas rhizosphaerae TaxID=2944682 RepID=A0AA41ZHU6_9GAMM|nr:phosphate ABC transporter substrate-binding protein PstS [Larsenimonas rhizosphaerae]MCM2131702.1 phosphate ABC transporter substrate-binding protein PstS [Larsenimonas rhizosphaerae]MCX2524971.1 phosphate ABC transporter substrate-binding protein PstS [Larsenimonas rhizosphaerae]
MLKHVAATLVTSSLMLGSAAAWSAETITGAGATFPYPVYSQWADAYQDATGVGLNYQAIGSGGGIKQITARTVTFGASDAPMKPEELAKNHLVQWPQIMGGVVPVVNVPGIDGTQLKLDGKTLARIYMGEVTNWNDEAIASLNPDMDLPDTRITPVYRAEGSGTNFLFTHYLAQVSDTFANSVGEGKSVAWPAGVGAKANAGVASQVAGTPGGIGYVEYAYAHQNNLKVAQLRNQDGQFVSAGSDSFKAAAANADWKHADGLYLVLTDQPGAQSWPIVGASFILMPTDVKDTKAAEQALKFFNWAYNNGGDAAASLDYVPMPDNVASMIRQDVWSKVQGDNGKAVWTN